jgi:putative DNA primase/helicase
MTLHHDTPELLKPLDILAQCTELMPTDDAYIEHELIQCFGSPEQKIHVDDSIVTINGVSYDSPIVLPIYNGHLEIVQCAVMQDSKPVTVMPDGLAKGFARYGHFDHAKPVIVTYNLEAFFKIAQTGYAVALVLLPTLCNSTLPVLKPFDSEQMQFVINQLTQAGYQQLYMPVRPEHLEAFKPLEESTAVRLLNQYQDDFACDLSQYESVEDVQSFLNDAIEQLPKGEVLPKGHLAKPMKWENGHFHITEAGLYFVEEDKNGISHKRFISSPVLVTAKTRDDSSNNWGVLLQWKDDNGVKHIQALSMELFQTDGADLRKALAYQGVTIAPDQRARNLFQCYLMSYRANRYALCVDRVGWHENVFVLPHVQIGQTADNDLIVYQASNTLDNRYQSKGTLAQWQSDVAQLVASHSLLVFSLSTAFTGQLLTPLNQQGGGFHIKGGSSKGKSTALNLACSVWGNPKNFYRTWRATGNNLEHTAYMHNDGFLVLDEIGEINNPKELGNIVYMLANGMGKGRMTKQITAKPMHQWKVIFLSSGEKSLKDIMQEQGQKTKLGQEIRLTDIDIDQSEHGIFDCIDFAEDGAKQSIELAKRLNQSYGVAGIAWLEYITSHKDQMIKQAEQLLDQYREALAAHHTQGHIVRVANYFALVAVAGELASQANITGWQSGTAFNAVQQVFNQWLGSFEQVGDFEDREMLAHVKAFFEANESSRFESITPDPDHAERIYNRVGYWKIENGEKVFYVMSEQFKNEICKGYDSRKVAKALLNYGLLEHDTGKPTKTVRLPNRTKALRVYAVKESIFSSDIDNFKGNKGNKGNNLDSKGFEHVAQVEMQKATKATNLQNVQQDTHVLPLLPNGNKKGNKENSSNINSVACVACVAHVAQEKRSCRDLVSESAQLKTQPMEQPTPKKQVKAKASPPKEVIDTKTIDMFGGGV